MTEPTHVLVPLRMTRAMQEVVEQEDWDWADLLAAAEAIDLAEYEAASQPATEPAAPAAGQVPFQARVAPWMQACFGPVISADCSERNHRFLEEALELVQACGCTEGEAVQLVRYVYGRPVGEKGQEVGGVMVTLAALCLAQQLDMHEAGKTELARIWTKVEAIRAKQAAKPKHSPLPATPTQEPEYPSDETLMELASRYDYERHQGEVVAVMRAAIAVDRKARAPRPAEG